MVEVSKPLREQFKLQTLNFTSAYILHSRYLELVRHVELIDANGDAADCPDDYLDKLKACAWLLFALQSRRK